MVPVNVKVFVGVFVGGTGVFVDEAVAVFVDVTVIVNVVVGGMVVKDGVGEEVRVFVEVKVGVEDAVHVGVAVLVQVRVFVTVGVGVDVEGMGMIWMASTIALSALAGPNWIEMAPPEGAILLNTSSRAMFCPPAVLYISKLVRTVLPLIETLKTLSPAAVQ
jgi:hypothetical protein